MILNRLRKALLLKSIAFSQETGTPTGVRSPRQLWVKIPDFYCDSAQHHVWEPILIPTMPYIHISHSVRIPQCPLVNISLHGPPAMVIQHAIFFIHQKTSLHTPPSLFWCFSNPNTISWWFECWRLALVVWIRYTCNVDMQKTAALKKLTFSRNVKLFFDVYNHYVILQQFRCGYFCISASLTVWAGLLIQLWLSDRWS